MRMIAAKERSTVELPRLDVIGEAGELRIRPDVLDRGLIQVGYVKGRLKLRVNGVVGLLPITDDVALDIRPKFPVSNLNRIVYASAEQLFQRPERPYGAVASVEYLPVPLVRAFSSSLHALIERGMYREYERQSVTSVPRPRIDFLKSHQRYWAKSDRTHAIVDHFVFTQDNIPNQCLKVAAKKALALSKSTPHLTSCVPLLARSLRQMNRVSEVKVADLDGVSDWRVRIPKGRSDYVEVLPQAIQLIRNIDHSLDPAKEGSLLESYIVVLDDAFERYVRKVLASLPSSGGGRISTVDGNARKHQRALFRDSSRYWTKPDLIIKDRSGIRMIGDVKYRIRPHEEDRYQIIAHALSYGASTGILVYPMSDQDGDVQLRRLGSIGRGNSSVVVHEYYFDLSACLDEQESLLREAVMELIDDAPSPRGASA